MPTTTGGREGCKIQKTDSSEVSIVIGNMGTIPERTYNQLKKLELMEQREELHMMITKASANILNSHFRRDDFRKSSKRNWQSLIWITYTTMSAQLIAKSEWRR